MSPRGLAIDAAGSAWFTTGNRIGRLTTGGTYTFFDHASLGQPAGIVAGPDGAMWFANPAATPGGPSSIGRISATGEVLTFPTPSNLRPTELVFDPAGTIWFTSLLDNAIGAFEAPPAPPTNVTAVKGDGHAGVAWSPPTFTGGRPITGYRITPSKGGVAQAPIDVGVVTTTTVTGLTNGSSYTFTVAAKTSTGTGSPSEPSVAVVPAATAPANDAFANAELIPSFVNGVSAVRSNVGATMEAGEPNPTIYAGGASTWAAYTPPEDGQMTVSTCGTPFDTLMGVYTGSSVGALTKVGEDDDGCGAGASKVTVNVVAGTKYSIQVLGYDPGGGPAQGFVSFQFSFVTTPRAPPTPSAAGGFGNASLFLYSPTNEKVPVTGYVVTPYVGGVAKPATTFDASTPVRTITNLPGGLTYTFKVAAINALGTGSQSAASNAVLVNQPFAPFGSWASLVRRLFVDITDTAPTSAQVNTWVSSLSAGTKTPGDLADALRRGAENTENVDPTARLYRAFLGRGPDAGGFRFWLGRRRTGTWTLTQIGDYFAASSEFKRKYGTLSNRAFVTRIYTDVLGRTADTAGVNYWTARLDSKKLSRGGVMANFSESSEYRRKQLENTDASMAFILLLGRAPTAAEGQSFVGFEKSSGHASTLLDVLRSDSYFTHITG